MTVIKNIYIDHLNLKYVHGVIIYTPVTQIRTKFAKSISYIFENIWGFFLNVCKIFNEILSCMR